MALVSGGVDSAVVAAVAKRDCGAVAMLHVNYGQRTEKRELEAFRALAEAMGARAEFVADAGYLGRMGGSALTESAIAVPEMALGAEGIPVTYVPFRNANLLAVGVSWAEVIGASRLYIGAVEEDSSGYPDCREEFLQSYARVIASGTRPETRIELAAPLLHMTKAGIVTLGASLGVPFELTWSCYREERLACGVCDSCLLRLKAFEEAGIEDPLPYVKSGRDCVKG